MAMGLFTGLILMLICACSYAETFQASFGPPALKLVTDPQEASTPGIPPCLIPPIRNLVYQYEATALRHPGIKTGCYVQFDSEGSITPTSLVFPRPSTVPLYYYVIDATGNKQFLGANGTVAIQFEANKSERQVFSFAQICFPMLCYSSQATHLRSCPNWVECAPFCDNNYNASWITRDHIRATTTHKTWILCKTDDLQIVPISSSLFPFGPVRTMNRVPYVENNTGPHLIFFIGHFDAYEDAIGTGCDVVFPLEPPFNHYMFRLWYLDRPGHFETIGEGKKGIVMKSVPSFLCEKYIPTFGERACQNGSVWMETYEFEDFCFPEECLQLQQHRCTGKAGRAKRNSTTYIVEFSDQNDHKTLMSSYTGLEW